MEISLNNSLNKVITTSEEQVLATEKTKLIVEIKNVKNELNDAYNNLNFVDDSLMVDYFTYQIKAIESRFDYLVKKAKAIGLNNI